MKKLFFIIVFILSSNLLHAQTYIKARDDSVSVIGRTTADVSVVFTINKTLRVQTIKSLGTAEITFPDSVNFTGVVSGLSSGLVGGSDTQIQYNNLSAFGGIANFIYDGTNIEIADDQDLAFGSNADWLIQYDEAGDNQLLIITANTSALATTDPMIEFLVGATPTANQQVFGIAKGTQASNTALFTVDEDGDGILLNSLTTPTIIGGTGTISDLNLQTTSGVGASGADMHFLVGNNGATEAMTILNDGNVGIGTANPVNELEVVATGENTAILIRSTSDDINLILESGGGSGDISAVLFRDITANIWQLIVDGVARDFVIKDRVNEVDVVTIEDGALANALYIDGTGVGIGTTQPQHLLHLLSGTTPQFAITHTAGADSATIGVDGNGLFTVTTVDGEGAAGHIALMPDGNVGIGTASPNNELDVNGSITIKHPAAYRAFNAAGQNHPVVGIDTGDNVNIGQVDASGWDDIRFQTADVDIAMIIKQTGLVGIGTATPDSTLEVNGSVVINGTENFAADGQADDDYEIDISGITALTPGLMVSFTATTANTDGATLEITDVGDLDAILKMHDQALATGDIEAGQIVVCVFDGSNWQMTSQLAQ